MKLIRRFAALLAAACIGAAMAGTDAGALTDPVTRQEITAAVSKGSVSGLKKVNNRVYSFKNGSGTPFTGKLKTSYGTQYCVQGSTWYGWIKVGTSWYYFSPDENGIMATGKYKTANGVYQFDKNGVWNGSVTKAAKANKDFTLRYEALTDEGYLCLDLSTGTLVNAPSQEEAASYTHKVKVTAKDRQIIYEMFMECGLNSMKSNLDYGGNGWTSVTATLSGGEFSALTGSDSYKAYSKDADVRVFSYFTAFMENYIHNMPEYLLSQQHRGGSEMSEIISDTKMFRYKGSSYGITEENKNTDVIFTSTEEVDSFINDVLYARKNSDFTFIKKLRSYEDDFFTDHVLLYTEVILPADSSTSPGLFTYDPAESLYTSNLNVKKGSNKKTKQFVIITLGRRSTAESSTPSGTTYLNIR